MKRRIILEPYEENEELWRWNIMEYDEKNRKWYCIDGAIEVNWDIAARKSKKAMQQYKV